MHTGWVTKKERLHALVDELADDQVDQLWRLAAELAGDAGRRRAEPTWFGAFRSGRGDLSERHEEILKAEIGPSA